LYGGEFLFANAEGMEQYWDQIVKTFANDYCARQNEIGQKSFIAAIIKKPEPEKARLAACFSDWMSDWYSLDQTGGNRQRHSNHYEPGTHSSPL